MAELAGRQHGVVSIRQLLGPLGYSQAAVARAVSDGRLHRLHSGVYAVGHTNLSLHGQCLAAVLACGPGAVLSHGSAAWLWGLVRSPWPLEATGPVPRRRRLPVVIHRARRLTVADRAELDGITMTAVPRTTLDMAARVQPDRLRRFLETHGTRDAFERDRVRDEDLALAGVETIRVTGPRFEREPKAVIGRIRRLLARRSPGT